MERKYVTQDVAGIHFVQKSQISSRPRESYGGRLMTMQIIIDFHENKDIDVVIITKIKKGFVQLTGCSKVYCLCKVSTKCTIR